MSALILIDLQNDFLAPSAPFKLDPKSQDSLRRTLEVLILAFRRSGGHIIWVQSHYSLNVLQERSQEPKEIAPTEEPIPEISLSLEGSTSTQLVREGHLDWVIEGTHTGKKPCCREGTYGAELVSWSDPLRHSNDAIVTKTFFSAFKESNLEEILVERNVKQLYFGGLLSNIQIWEIYVVIDALGWRRQESHRRALETMEGCGVHLMGSKTFTEIQ